MSGESRKFENLTGLKVSLRRDSTIRIVSNEMPDNASNNSMQIQMSQRIETELQQQQNGVLTDEQTTTTQPMEQDESDNDENIKIDFEMESEPKTEMKLIPLKMPRFAIPKKPKSTIEKVQKRLGIECIFPGICFPFLNDDCVELGNCYYSHALPSNDDVYERLVKFGAEKMGKLFHTMIARVPCLLNRYFEIFVEFFALHTQRGELMKTIAICERELARSKEDSKFRFLIKSFMQSGLSYETSMQHILLGLSNTDILPMLLNIRMVQGITMKNICNIVEVLVSYPEFVFKPSFTEYLMEICIQTRDKDLIPLVMRILRDFRQISGLDQNVYLSYVRIYAQLNTRPMDMIRAKKMRKRRKR